MRSNRFLVSLACTAAVLLATTAQANQAPVAQPDSATTSEDVAITLAVTANDSDPDGDTVLLALNPIILAPTHGTATRVSSTSIRYTPHANYFGSDSFRYRIHDGNGSVASAMVTLTIVEVNDPPVANADAATTSEEVAVTIVVTANDTDVDGDSVTLISNPVVTAPAHGTAVKVSGSSIRYTPHTNFSGTDTFRYEVGDNRGLRSRAWVTITVNGVNDPPNAQPDAVSTSEDTAVTVTVTANDSDPDGDPVTLVTNPIILAPEHGTAVRVSSTQIRYTPHANYFGSDLFRYRVQDGKGAIASALVTVTVVEVNDAPVARADAATTGEDVAVTVNVTANDTDADGDPITLITSPVVTAPTNGTAVKVSGTSIKYTPKANFSGTDTFRYEVGDNRGLRARAWVTITVTGVNDPPDAVPDAVSTNEDTAVTVAVTANDSDPDGDPVTLVLNPIVLAPTHGTAVRVSSTQVRYTPHANYFGSDTFRYRIQDGQGGLDSALVTVTVAEVNDAPVAVDDAASTQPGSPVQIVVTANDSDVDGDVVTLISNPIVTAPANGTAVKLSGSTIEYTPNAGFKGEDTFRYEAGDGRGLRAQASVTVTVLNNPPTAADDAATAHVATPTLIDVTANDTDPDGDTVVLIADPIKVVPTRGTAVKVSGCCIQYTGQAGFTGQDTFQYEAGDGHGGRSRAWVTVNVTNQPPVAVDDVATTSEGVATDITVTQNDSDPDGDAVRVATIVAPPAQGTATRLSDTTVRYTPSAGFHGQDTFRYQIDDGHGLTAQADVTVTVTQPPPEIDLISPRYLPKESIWDVTVSGSGFEGATVSVPTDSMDPSRAYPAVTVLSASATAIQLRFDMSDPAVEGFFTLAVDTPGGSAAIDFRVVPPGPVVDAWSPSQVGGGSLFAIAITGAQLAGASLSASAPGVAILQLDNTDDEFLSGLLQVSDGAPSGLGELIVQTDSGTRRLPIEVGSGTPAALSTRAISGSGSSSGGSGPTVYMQEPVLSPELQAMADSRVLEKTGSACITFNRSRSRSHRSVFAIMFDPITGGVLERAALEALAPGQSLDFGLQIVAVYASFQISISVQFCLDGSSGRACIQAEVGAFVIGIGGQGFYFSACAGFGQSGGYEIKAGASGAILNAHWSTSSSDGSSSPGCLQINDLDGASPLGLRQTEAQAACCETSHVDLVVGMEIFGTFREDPFDFGDVAPTCAPPDSALQDQIAALFLGKGPLSVAGNRGCHLANGWAGFADGTVVVRVSDQVPSTHAYAIASSLPSVAQATNGRVGAVFETTTDSLPREVAANEVLSLAHPNPSTIQCPPRPGESGWVQCCPTDDGCTRANADPFTGLIKGALVIQPTSQTLQAFVHDVVGHGVLGMCHIDGNQLASPGESLMSAGQGVFSGATASSPTSLDIRAAQTVYGSSLPRGSDCAAFASAGLVAQSSCQP